MGTGILISIIAVIIIGILVLIIKNTKKEKGGVSIHPTKKEMIEYTPTGAVLTPIGIQFFELMNAHRRSINLNNLKIDGYCKSLAWIHNDYMIKWNVINHDNAFRRHFELERRGSKDTTEIVSRNYTKPESFLNAYLKSTGHKEAIETPGFTHVGIDFMKNDSGKYYNTCVFAKF